MEKQFNDYAAEYEDCVEVLEKPLPEYVPYDEALIKPKVDERHFRNVNSLFDDDDVEEAPFFDIEKHWQGMPACENRQIKPYKQILVNLMTEDDLIAFAKCINQKLTPKTKSIWFPIQDTIAPATSVWTDEQEFDSADE